MEKIAYILLGTVISFIATGLRDWCRTKKENKKRYTQIIERFQFNLDRLVQMEGQLTSIPQTIHPDYRLDLTVLDFLIAHGPNSFTNKVHFEIADKCRYQLHHINVQLMFLFSSQSQSPQYLQTVLDHIKGEIKNIRQILGKT